MELTPREKDKLLLFTAALLAERRRVIEQQREDIAAVLGEIDTLERLCADLLAGESVAEGAT